MTELTEVSPATDLAPPPALKSARVPNATSRRKQPGPSATKADAIVALLSRARGATLDDMMKATGWQAHSLRGFISGALKKKQGREVTSEKTEKGRIYRLAREAR